MLSSAQPNTLTALTEDDAFSEDEDEAERILAERRDREQPNEAFTRHMTPSAVLAIVVGTSPLPRTQATKKLWAYIKRNGLQDEKDRRMINADAKLRPIFNKDRISMFEMTKLVSKHLR
jgi:chromatin remodeling complex protein RSC6